MRVGSVWCVKLLLDFGSCFGFVDFWRNSSRSGVPQDHHADSTSCCCGIIFGLQLLSLGVELLYVIQFCVELRFFVFQVAVAHVAAATSAAEAQLSEFLMLS